jgi:hypothetical protein
VAVVLARADSWSGLGSSPEGALIWGEFADRSAKPYRVAVNLRNFGNKCTCPWRKRPCVHVLALLWLNAETMLLFPPVEPPEWVSSWVEMPEDSKATARREAATARRAEDVDRAVLDVLDALEQWFADQLRTGLSAFVDDAPQRCRNIAARLVDGKAAALAERIDELPSRLLALPAGDRTRGAVVELGKLVLLARAFRLAPRDADVRRAVASAETRETVLRNPGTLRVRGVWEVLAKPARTHRDGSVWQSTWILNLDGAGPRFAMLFDRVRRSPARRETGFAPGDRFVGELAFFPARNPLRALLVEHEPMAGDREFDWPASEGSLADALAGPLLAEPWALDVPMLLPAGQIALDAADRHWWRSHDGSATLPVAGNAPKLIRSTELTRVAALWSGNRLAILAARTPLGWIKGHG